MTQTSLTDTQLIILSAAAQRDDFRIEPPERLRGGAVMAVLATLLAKALIEADSKPDDNDGTADIGDANRPTYRISRKGLAAIGIEGEADGDPAKPNAGATETTADVPAVETGQPTIEVLTSAAFVAPRAGTKLADVISLLQQPDGASIDELIAATGWLAHTTRAALTGLRKRGIIIERAKRADGTTIYRVATAADETAGEVA